MSPDEDRHLYTKTVTAVAHAALLDEKRKARYEALSVNPMPNAEERHARAVIAAVTPIIASRVLRLAAADYPRRSQIQTQDWLLACAEAYDKEGQP